MEGDGASLKEFQNLLKNSVKTKTSVLKKYARLAIPHVGLVSAVCIYAVIGAWVFYSLESPHEDRLKIQGVKKITEMRRELVNLIWQQYRNENEQGKIILHDEWVNRIRQNLKKFNENLYCVYKNQYVRYGDVQITSSKFQNSFSHDTFRPSRHRSSKRWEKDGKLWTASSSLFFAATTMATIGYGNIVPVTSKGRIACIVFALFGAPLAIVTIGDLGKFLSECTIWLYRNLRAKVKTISQQIKIFQKKSLINQIDVESLKSNNNKYESNMNLTDWDDLEKSEVPVLVVFTILLLYIAFGGVLFAFLESWTYMDAFYYCFVSLTTIGFGDLVPSRHEYIIIMLIYLGVGLAVTTMCIDLVGIQYIQKIHYFGRKFKGTDILQILRRKRMLERRFAMGKGKEFIEYMIQVTQEKPTYQSETINPKQIISLMKTPNQSFLQNKKFDEDVLLETNQEEKVNWCIEDKLLLNTTPVFKFPVAQCNLAQKMFTTVFFLNDKFNDSESSERSLMYKKWNISRFNSWVELGPDLSSSCLLSTSSSVYEREALYSNFRSPTILSFDSNFSNSKNEQIEKFTCKKLQRSFSCPFNCLFLSTKNSNSTENQMGLTCIENEDSCNKLNAWNKEKHISIENETKNFDNLSDSMIKSIENDIKSDDDEFVLSYSEESFKLFYQEANFSETFETKEFGENQEEMNGKETLASINFKRSSIIESAIKSNIQNNLSFANKTDSPEVQLFEKNVNIKKNNDLSNDASNFKSDSEDKPFFNIDLVAFELVNNKAAVENLFKYGEPLMYHKDVPVHSVHHDTVQTEAAIENLMTASPNMLTNIVPPTMVADNYCFVVDGDKVNTKTIMGDHQWWRHTSRPTKYFYSEDLKKFYRVNCLTIRGGRIVSARLADSVPAISSNKSNDSISTTCLNLPGNQTEDTENKNFKSSLINKDQAALFLQTPNPTQTNISKNTSPIRKQKTDISSSALTATTKKRAALASARSLISDKSDYTDNIESSSFLKVPNAEFSNFLQTYSTTPRNSLNNPPKNSAPKESFNVGQRGESVNLAHVYKVIRFYSFWKTCTSFHRIVTMIEKVNNDEIDLQKTSSFSINALGNDDVKIITSNSRSRSPSPNFSNLSNRLSVEQKSEPTQTNFKKRFFIQYLWRNAKLTDKVRVQREFDPQKQELLSFVNEKSPKKSAKTHKHENRQINHLNE